MSNTETIKIVCPPNVWTQVSEEHQSLYLQNRESKTLKIHFGDVEPIVDTDAFIVSQDYNPAEKLFTFPYTSRLMVWVMPFSKAEATSVVVVRTKNVSTNNNPMMIRTITTLTYTLTNDDGNFLLDFTAACVITVPANLVSGFSCGLRQGGADRIRLVPASGVTLEEIDGRFYSEKRLAIITIARFPNLSYQIAGRTSA